MNNPAIYTKSTYKTKKIIFAALLAALTFVGTMIIKIPTPTNGYIHPGDGFVLLCGLLLGPIWGGLAGGLGSALSDFIGGYFIYAPATFMIKAITAMITYFIYHRTAKLFKAKSETTALIIAGILGEGFMVFGYFLFEVFSLVCIIGSTMSAAKIASTAGIIPNIILLSV